MKKLTTIIIAALLFSCTNSGKQLSQRIGFYKSEAFKKDWAIDTTLVSQGMVIHKSGIQIIDSATDWYQPEKMQGILHFDHPDNKYLPYNEMKPSHWYPFMIDIRDAEKNPIATAGYDLVTKKGYITGDTQLVLKSIAEMITESQLRINMMQEALSLVNDQGYITDWDKFRELVYKCKNTTISVKLKP